MKPLPKTEYVLVLRTDFSDDRLWQSVCNAIKTTGDFEAPVDCVSDPEYDGITVTQLLSLNPPSSGHTFMFIVDSLTLSDPAHLILAVDFVDEPGRTFRVTPSNIDTVATNLWLANLDFRDFANATGSDGVFTGG